jgi:hypothetical protein
VRRGLVVAGVLVMAYGLVGIAGDRDRIGIVLFLVAVLALHDGLFLPLVLGAGAVISRVVPGPWQGTVRAAGIVGLAVAVVGVPLAVGPLTGAYGKGLVLILVVIGVVVAGRKGIERWWKGRGGRARG